MDVFTRKSPTINESKEKSFSGKRYKMGGDQLRDLLGVQDL